MPWTVVPLLVSSPTLQTLRNPRAPPHRFSDPSPLLLMRLTACTIDAYGPLHDVSFPDLDAPVVVVYGPNEAGKTALFSFFTAMLYGIHPPVANDHPYTPYNGDALGGKLQARLHDGGTLTVARRLRSNPYGRLTNTNGSTSTISNNPLAPVTHVSRDIYKAVYALTLGDLVTLHEQNAWDEIQDRLLGSLSVDFVRSARTVSTELQAEADALWRPDRQGTPEATTLAETRDELYQALKEARQRDNTLRSLREQCRTVAERIETLKAEQRQLRIDRLRDERLRPVYTLLQHIERNEAEAGDLSPYTHINDPDAEHKALTERLDALSDQLDQLHADREAHEAALAACTEQDRALIQHAPAIEAWTQRIDQAENEREAAAQAKEDADAAYAELERSASCLTEPWSPKWTEAVKALNLPEIRSRIYAYTEAAADEREARTQAQSMGLQGEAERSLVPPYVLGVAGLALLLIGLIWTSVIALSMGGTATVAGAVWAWHSRRYNEELAHRLQALELDALTTTTRERRAAVHELLSDVPLPEDRLDSPNADLAHDLERLQRAVHDAERAQNQVEQHTNRFQEEQAAWDILVNQVHCTDLYDTHDAWRTQVRALAERLQNARPRVAAAETAEDALPSLNKQITAIESERATTQEQMEALRAPIERLGNGDWSAGVQTLNQRRAAARRAENAREQLKREHPEWQAAREEIQRLGDTDAFFFTDEARITRSERLDAIHDALHDANERRAELDAEYERLVNKPTMATLQSDIEAVETELDRVRTERDRLMLMATLIRRADHEFRMKHQPDVIQRASAHIATITNGRYERMEWREEDDRLVVHPADHDDVVPVGPPLSRGTRDQIYLALRMAIVDHLDADHEALPMFLDEVFVNWDTERRQAGYEILKSWESTRQIVLFTCHRPLVKEAREMLDAAVLRLPAPSAA